MKQKKKDKKPANAILHGLARARKEARRVEGNALRAFQELKGSTMAKKSQDKSGAEFTHADSYLLREPVMAPKTPRIEALSTKQKRSRRVQGFNLNFLTKIHASSGAKFSGLVAIAILLAASLFLVKLKHSGSSEEASMKTTSQALTVSQEPSIKVVEPKEPSTQVVHAVKSMNPLKSATPLHMAQAKSHGKTHNLSGKSSGRLSAKMSKRRMGAKNLKAKTRVAKKAKTA